ncbi:MAG: PQQ-binding-like beta-propeller repeat protein [Gemmataceae bacterium]
MKRKFLSLFILMWFGFTLSEACVANANEILKTTGVRGGLVVHLGCGDGKLTVQLRAGDQFVVHGLDTDQKVVDQARRNIAKQGHYGQVSVARLVANTLPYADGLVNLLVVEKASGVSREEMLRVLVPQGVLYVREGEGWKKVVKPASSKRDEWTHFLHGPDGNPVAKDSLVGPPKHVQWMGTPKFSRGHEQQASFSTCVTSAGRMYFIADEAPAADIRIPSVWKLVARDAYNGVILWKRDIGKWVSQFRRFRSGPANLQFRIVAAGDRVFATLSLEGPVHILDAASGKTLRIIEGSKYTKQILHHDGKLVLVTDEFVGKVDEIDKARRRGKLIKRKCRLLQVDVETGKQLWSKDIDNLVFANVALKNGRLFAQTPDSVLCLDAKSGKQQWETKFATDIKLPARRIANNEMQWESPSLLVGDKAVYAADFRKIHAYSLDEGKLLWSDKSVSGYNTPPDIHLVGNVLWMDKNRKRVGVDPVTGKVKKQFTPARGYMHARCYRNKATEQFLMLGQMGVQVLDLEKGDIWDNDWVRGTCQYGVLPANGLLYVPPNCCACNMKSKLIGITALSAQRTTLSKAKTGSILERGPSFRNPKGPKAWEHEWPTFRGNASRQGVSDCKVPTSLKSKWRTKIGGKLSAVVVAGGLVYVAAVDQHKVYALDANTGKTVWTFTAGGRIDSPPTIYESGAYFGSADGWVYAVTAADGKLMWRLRVAPEDRLVMNEGQLESAWPVHGSVLVHEGELKVAAGRSSYLDGGIRLYRVDPKSGQVLSQKTIYSPTDEGKQPKGGGRDVRGALADILSVNDGEVYMRHVKLDFETGVETGSGTHLYSPLGFLDDTWWHRAYWVFGDQFTSHWSGWWRVGNQVPSGRIMSYDAESIYGFGRDKYNGGNTGQWRGGEKYQLYAVDRNSVSKDSAVPPKGKKVKGQKGKKKRRNRTPKQQFQYRWTKQVPLLATGLVVTKEAVFIAGPPDVIKTAGPQGESALKLTNPDEVTAAWAGKKGGVLYAAAVSDGQKLAQQQLPSPTVFDGLAAANGRLYAALKDGSLVCLAGE